MSGWYWYADNPNCGRCGHLNSQGFCNMTACVYPVLPQTQTMIMTEHRLTNAMRIRLKSDEQLAAFIADIADCGVCEEMHGFRMCDAAPEKTCDQCWLGWLQSEVTT